jgi:hypothetical protein
MHAYTIVVSGKDSELKKADSTQINAKNSDGTLPSTQQIFVCSPTNS